MELDPFCTILSGYNCQGNDMSGFICGNLCNVKERVSTWNPPHEARKCQGAKPYEAHGSMAGGGNP